MRCHHFFISSTLNLIIYSASLWSLLLRMRESLLYSSSWALAQYTRSSLFSVSMCAYLWLAILSRYWWFHLPCGLHRCRKVFSCLTLSSPCTVSKSVYISFPHLVHFVGGISAPSSMAVLSVLSIFFWACEWGSDYVLDSCRCLDAAPCALHMCASYSYGAFSI